MHDLPKEQSKKYYDLLDGNEHSRIYVYCSDHLEILRAKIAKALAGPEVAHLDDSFLLLRSTKGEGQVLLHFDSYDRICFHQLIPGDLMRTVLATVSSIVAAGRYSLEFNCAGISTRSVPNVPREHWAEFEEVRIRMRRALR